MDLDWTLQAIRFTNLVATKAFVQAFKRANDLNTVRCSTMATELANA